jgi:hypothetical protein
MSQSRKLFLLGFAFLGTLHFAHAQLSFSFSYTDSNTGFTDPTLGAQRQAALETAAQNLAASIPLSTPITVTFEVKSTNENNSTLASASSDFSGDDVGFAPTIAQQKILTGTDSNGSAADGSIEWNFFHDWDLDNSIATQSYDFISTAMHEILHAIGFTSSIANDSAGGGNFVVNPGEPNGWYTFDKFLVKADGSAFINNQFIFNPSDLDQLGNNPGLFFAGSNAVAANGGSPVPIYSPNPWEEGSSGSHTDDNTFTGALALLMNAATETGPGVRTLSAIEIGILKDLGFNIVSGGSSGSAGFAYLSNMSVRSTAGTGDNALNVGIVVGGTGSKSMLLRVVGPTLGLLGVPGVVADPRLQLFRSVDNNNVSIENNDNWGSSTQLAELFSTLGAFPLQSNLDAALFTTQNPGVYPVVVDTKGASGVVLVEGYDTQTPTAGGARFLNVSARSQVGTGGDVLVAGFVIEGTGTKTLLIRGVGATLGNFGVNGVLQNPQLIVRNSATNVIVASNDNWNNDATVTSTSQTLGAFALSSTSDAALVVTLPPGVYTATVSGVADTTGIALVEVYDAD